MTSAKWIGAAFGCALLGALAVACGASGTSSTSFAEDAGSGGDLDANTFVTDSGSTADSGKPPVKPADAGSDSGVVIDAGPSGNPVGFPCATPTDCQSGLCEPVVAGSGSICVSTCSAQADCTDNFFCDPLTAGNTNGYCVPHSPTHCSICTDNTDCGSLSEVCGVAGADTAKACHIDCSLAPIAGTTAACPSDYACQSTLVDGVTRQICMPKAPITNCVDAVGGFCDRVSTPQTCDRTNTAGICVGSRTCSSATNRYSSCDAAAPACRNCTTTNPIGCTENLCSNAATDVNNCGSCGNICSGQGQANDLVTCTIGTPYTCTFACEGESYDVNNNPADGCEVTDTTTGNHSQGSASSGGSVSCHDGSHPTIGGAMPSDLRGARTNPAVAGFDATSGSAPDVWDISATGGACDDEVDLTLTVSGSSHAACYHMHIVTDKHTYDCDTSSAGTCTVDDESNSRYSDGSQIYVTVSKSDAGGCAATDDNMTYTVTGHL